MGYSKKKKSGQMPWTYNILRYKHRYSNRLKWSAHYQNTWLKPVFWLTRFQFALIANEWNYMAFASKDEISKMIVQKELNIIVRGYHPLNMESFI